VPDRPALALSRGRRRVVVSGILLGMFLGALEATVMGTAMPTVVASLGGLEHYAWVFTSYMLASTATTPIWGRLSDQFGRRRVYLAGMLVFLVGSALAGLATSMPALVGFRAVQGLGAGAIVPVGLTIIGEIFTLTERARMQAVFSATWGIGSVVGPLVGGWLTDNWSWRWVFFVNLPFGVAAAAVLRATYPGAGRLARAPVDWLGAALLAASVTSLLCGVSGVGGTRLVWLVAAAGLGVGFLRVERHAREPVLPLDLLGHPGTAALNGTALLVGMAIFGAIAFVPLFARAAEGASATEAGAVLTPLMLGWVVMSTAAARLMLHVGQRQTVRVGLAVMALAFVVLARFPPGAAWGLLLADVALLGAGTGLSMLTLLLTTQHLAPKGALGLATSLQLFSRSIGGALGVALMGAVFAAGVGGEAAATNVVEALPAGGAPTLAGPRVVAALHQVFGVGAVIVVTALLVSLALPRGADARGRADGR
jgi:EmrB/QacA subfamily drug resistance transporter